ncbi:MAG: hypothetical protein J7603_00415 [Pseudacidovorax sp.]|nr:hypothetical protein [Pseudacidovorax sp.]
MFQRRWAPLLLLAVLGMEIAALGALSVGAWLAPASARRPDTAPAPAKPEAAQPDPDLSGAALAEVAKLGGLQPLAAAALPIRPPRSSGGPARTPVRSADVPGAAASPRLNLVLVPEGRVGGVAVIDDRMVRPGQVLEDGSTVTAIHRGAISLAGPTGEVIRLPVLNTYAIDGKERKSK